MLRVPCLVGIVILSALVGSADDRRRHIPKAEVQASRRRASRTRDDFEEQKRGFIAPMKELKIKADAGHVAWDMERFQSLNMAVLSANAGSEQCSET